MESTEISDKKQSIYEQRPWLFKPGQSGNPAGRPKGSKSLKSFAKEYILSLSDEEKLEFLKGMDKKDVWEMAEDKAGQGVQISGELTSKIVQVDE